MKLYLTVFCLCLGTALTIPASLHVVQQESTSDLRSKQCSWGPSFWCQNLTNARNCGAVTHCIQTVWEHQLLPPDNGNICQICLQMVTEARSQLESNETQEELRQVFEGSCKLIPVKIVAKECTELCDNFIPELVETLASQMNPQIVCAVAGLCNNARINSLLVNGEASDNSSVVEVKDECEDCNQIAKEMEQRFSSTPKDDILNNMLEVCGQLGSLSDGCSAIIVTHFNSLHNHLSKNLRADGLCHLAGVCQYKFHTHSRKNIEITHESSIGVVRPSKDDLPCELCEQLVVHLRDILVANTTEQEFEQVLRGVCSQFSNFKTQCLDIVNEYYGAIYNFLVNSLNPNKVCSLMGICPVPGSRKFPIWPLLPVETAELYEVNKQNPQVIPGTHFEGFLIGTDEANSYSVLHRVPVDSRGVGVRVKQMELQPGLPIQRMMPDTVTYVANKEVCATCEYVLHYLQVVLTSPATELKIKQAVTQVCDHLPDTIESECRDFITTYGDAILALLAQEIDPSQVCPKLGLCPTDQVLLDLTHQVTDKPTCPLCLFAVQELDSKLQNNKTGERIREALDNLCKDLPKSLVADCKKFVDEYSEQLIEMLVADFTPQEVCVYLKLCDAPTISQQHEILSNEIPTLPSNNVMVHNEGKGSTPCVLCEFVLSKIDDELMNKATEKEIRDVVHNVCNHMPKTVTVECNQFVDQYADLVITLLAETLDPKEVCTEIHLCVKKSKLPFKQSFEECAVCDATLGALDKLLSDPHVEKDVAVALQRVCGLLPPKDTEKCKSMIKIYGPSILNLIARHTPTHSICEAIALCPRNRQIVKLLGGKQCTWGPEYWCQSEEHAKACGATIHCQERVWMSHKPISN